MTTDHVRIVDVHAEPNSGLRLQVWRRPSHHCDASITNHDGRELYRNVLWPDARTAIESAVDYVRVSLGLGTAASVLKANALAELAQ